MHRVTIATKMTNERPPESFDPGASSWSVTLRFKGRRLTVPFYTGSLAGEPDAAGVLDCLISDTYAGEQDFDEFCAEYGYDTDSRKAEATWHACRREGHKVRRFLGDDFDTIEALVRDGRDPIAA